MKINEISLIQVNIPSLQSNPWNGATHAHVKLLFPSLHFPSLKHGFCTHSLLAGKKQEIVYQCGILLVNHVLLLNPMITDS